MIFNNFALADSLCIVRQALIGLLLYEGARFSAERRTKTFHCFLTQGIGEFVSMESLSGALLRLVDRWRIVVVGTFGCLTRGSEVRSLLLVSDSRFLATGCWCTRTGRHRPSADILRLNCPNNEVMIFPRDDLYVSRRPLPGHQ